ncbi:PAS domain S-box protein [Methanocella arvoryzae]|uniref:Signal transduction protein n=1 Tax=Methanocella arvoryzae (strain DSM 22066 / NBRC 105507 / MRE50) TaxID=351160 RepID=Q0W2Z7_METAR|nr:PAS domain S-box protein [Methanocella arvoryzae]CAJ37246.1 putative signal transduction protein [Methanocella arvoryzae MRE50]
MVNARLLVVEDESIVAKDIQHRLRNLGYEVPAVVAYGEKAIEKAGELQPDLVLMDIFLKGEMDGIQAAEEIKRQYDIPVIFLTAFADPNTLQRAKITEPFGYILKPFEERELLTAIEMALYKHKMERRLKESERWLSVTLKSIGDAIITTDMAGKITFMNHVAENLTGWKQEEAHRRDLFGIFNLIDEAGRTLESPVSRVIKEGAAVIQQNDVILIARNGNEIAIDSSAAPIRDDKNNTIGAVLVFRDITERKQTEEALQFTQFSVDHAADAAFWVRDDGHFFYVNEAACQSLGYRRDELLRMSIADISEDITEQEWPDHMNRLKEHGRWTFESKHRKKDGKVFPVEVTTNVLKFNGREYICTFARDITERKQAEQTLMENNRHLEIISSITSTINKSDNTRDMLDHVLRDILNLLEIDSGAIYLFDSEDASEMKLRAAVTRLERGRVVRYKQTVPGITIVDQGSIFYSDSTQYLYESDGASAVTNVPISVKDKVVGIMTLSPGRSLDASDTRELLSISSQLGIAVDNHRLFKKIQDTSNYLASIINESPDPMLTTDASGLIVSFNRSASRLLSYAQDEVVGRPVNSLLPPGTTLDLGDSKSYVREFKCKDGSVIKLTTSTARLYKDGIKSGFIITLKDLSEISGLRVVPVTENTAAPETSSAYRFDPGVIYLFDKKKRQDHMEVFADQVKHNIQGLCITRQNPKKIREKYGLEKTPIIWLNSGEGVAGESVIKPDNMTSLGATIYKFMSEAKDGLILLDGMEYLMMRSSYETLLKFIHYLNDRIMMSNSRVVFCIDTRTIDERQLHILMSEMMDFDKVAVANDSMQIAPKLKVE